MFVHVANGLESVFHLGYFSKITVGIPVIYLEHGAGLPVCRRLVIEFSKEVVGIGRIRDQDGAVLAGAAADDYVGTSATIHCTRR